MQINNKFEKVIPSMGNFSAMNEIIFRRKDEQSICAVVSIKYNKTFDLINDILYR